MFDGINWATTIDHFYHLAIAFALALPLGWEREINFHSAGLRTFPLVAVAACGFMLVGIDVFATEEARGRVLYGIITGIGFIGGGAILKNSNEVLGTSTAASLWNTGAIGTAVAWNRFEIAALLSLVNYVTLVLGRVSKSKKETSDKEA